MIIWTNGGDVGTNYIVNYFMGVVLVLGFMVSSFLNPAICIYHRFSECWKNLFSQTFLYI